MKKTYIFLTALLFIFKLNAQDWNISAPEFNDLGSVTETVVVEGLTIYAIDGKSVDIDANKKDLDEVEYTHRMKVGGTGSFSDDGPVARVVGFSVDGDVKITIMAMSGSGSEDRVLNISAGSKDNILDGISVLGADLTASSVIYRGEAEDIYIWSPSSGVNIYRILVEEAPAEEDPGEEDPEDEFITLPSDWNISADEFNDLGSITETLNIEGLNIYATEGKAVDVDANKKSLDEINYTHRMKLGGSGEFSEGEPSFRVLSFTVPGDAKITIMAMSASGSEDRVLNIAAGSEDNILEGISVLGASLTSSSIIYRGEAENIYIWSPNSGVNIYRILVEEAPEEEDPGSEDPGDEDPEYITLPTEWNIGAPEFNGLGTISETVKVEGLNIYAAEGKTIVVESNKKELDGVEYTHRMKLGGVGEFSEGEPAFRVLGFSVAGDVKITVMAMSSSSSEDRVLNVAAGSEENILDALPVLGASLTASSVTYVGEATNIYIWSPSSGVNVYGLLIEEAPIEEDPEDDYITLPTDWNISAPELSDLGTITETVNIEGLNIYAAEGKSVVIETNKKNLDGVEYTHRMKLGGSGEFSEGEPAFRVLGFSVPGDAKITVMSMSSSSSEDRVLNIAAGSEENILEAIPALGPSLTASSVTYLGEATNIYIWSPSSGVNIYRILVEEPSDDPEPGYVLYLSDFENGLTNPFGVWNGEISVVDNPAKDDVNNSDLVLLHEGNPWSGVSLWYDEENAMKPGFKAFEFEVYFDEDDMLEGDDGTPKAYFKLYGANSAAGHAEIDVGVNVTEGSKWVTVSLDLSSLDLDAVDYKQIAIQSEVGNYYVDNLRFISEIEYDWVLPDLEEETFIPKQTIKKNIFSINKAIVVNDSEGKFVTVYNTNGSQIYGAQAQTSEITIPAISGIYIVVIDNIATKVIVR